MQKNKKTALVVCLGVFVSILLSSKARAAGDLTSFRLAVEEALVAGETVPEAPPAIAASAEETVLPTAALESSDASPMCIFTAEPGVLAIVYEDLIAAIPEETIVGIASFYDEPQETASGEPFDPDAFTAAAQLEIRDRFGGILFGANYLPAYGIAEYNNKKIILKFNDVGPLLPGRKFDLSRAAMAYFDGLEKGLLPDFKVTPLPLGRIYPAGPVTDAELAALGIADADEDVAIAQAEVTPTPDAIEPAASGPAAAEPAAVSARLYAVETMIGES